MKQLPDTQVSVAEREKIRRLLKLYMAQYGREDGTPLTTYTTGEKINEYIDKHYGGSANVDGSRILSRNAIDNYLKGKTHTPDKKIQAIKAFLLSVPGFVKPEQVAADDTIERAAIAMCDFYAVQKPTARSSRYEQHYLFTASEAGKTFTFDFSLGLYGDLTPDPFYMPVRGMYSYRLEDDGTQKDGFAGFEPIRCDGFGIAMPSLLYLILRSTVRRKPLFFSGGAFPAADDPAVAALFLIAPAKGEIAQSVPAVYHGTYIYTGRD